MEIDFKPKAWLESYDSKVPVAETVFTPRDSDGKPRKLPAKYIVFHDDQQSDGADDSVEIIAHDLEIELYTRDGDDLTFRIWLLRQNVHYSAQKLWISTEQMFETIFYLRDKIFEKVRK